MRFTHVALLLLFPVVLFSQTPALTRAELLKDWLLQDAPSASGVLFQSNAHGRDEGALLDRVAADASADIRKRIAVLESQDAVGADPRWQELYFDACMERRARRLRPLLEKWERLVFTKHFNMGGSHYAYTEAQSDAQAERNFIPGAALCVLELTKGVGSVSTLRMTTTGVIRDPDVSFDEKRLLFSQKNSDRGDDYHLYEMDLDTRAVRQITEGEGVADYEGIYLPDGGIAFASTRCVHTVPCWWTEVSNLYRVESDGSQLRRLNNDQVHTTYPQLLNDGRISYTRWEYSDRGQIFPQPLFLMNPDGTQQGELYGNSSWFPTTILHARPLPSGHRIVCVLAGHHTYQTGKLALLDTEMGRQENEGVQLIAPVRETPAVKVDAYGQDGELFQYPYAVTDREFIVGYHPGGDRIDARFAIALIDIDGNRELLVADKRISCNQPVPLAARKAPPIAHGVLADDRTKGVYRSGNVYVGPGSKGIPKGLAKRLRVVALDYRPAGIGHNEAHGPAGMAIVSTPIAIGDGSWDVKRILGSVPIEEDGSASFEVPAMTPLYFQLLDDKNHVIQTMRSWTMVQPGETATCIGCHARKKDLPNGQPKMPIAFTKPPRKIDPFYGPPRGFSFSKEVQPILDAKCVSCHFVRPKERLQESLWSEASVLSALGASWRWTEVAPKEGWTTSEATGEGWKTGQGGFGRRGTPGGEVKTNWHTRSMWAQREFELETLPENQIWALKLCHDEDVDVFLNGVRIASEAGYVTSYRMITVTDDVKSALRVGRNTLAFHCRQTGGGQFIDMALLSATRPPQVVAATEAPGVLPAFSLLSEPNLDVGSKREWSDAYLALTGAQKVRNFMHGRSNELVNWISAQSVPDALPAYHKGAATSGLMRMLDGSHHGVVLNAEEKDKIACWIDLLVPFCGDYTEHSAWTDSERAKYDRYAEKRTRFNQ